MTSRYFREALRHNRQCQVVPVAAFVVDLEGVITARDGRAIRKVGKGAADEIS